MTDIETSFLGHTVHYWLELEERFRREGPINGPDLLQEVVTLQGKLAFYESRIRQMASQLGRAA